MGVGGGVGAQHGAMQWEKATARYQSHSGSKGRAVNHGAMQWQTDTAWYVSLKMVVRVGLESVVLSTRKDPYLDLKVL